MECFRKCQTKEKRTYNHACQKEHLLWKQYWKRKLLGQEYSTITDEEYRNLEYINKTQLFANTRAK